MKKAVAAAIASLVLLSGCAGTDQPASDSGVGSLTVSMTAMSSQKYKFKNCTALRKVYPHGVGKANAKDKTSGKKVTSFKKSTALYKKIVAYRRSLDRDKDGIACEKK